MAGVRFLHTADWQIGMKAVHIGTAAERVRRERLETARRVVDVAREREVQFILVAGDTFEDHCIGRPLVRHVAEILSAARVPVFLLPGNHDPLGPGSVWDDTSIWTGAGAGNLHVLRTPQPLPLHNGVGQAVTLFPCPLTSRNSLASPVAWISGVRRPEEGIRIGVAHGTVEGAPAEVEPASPIPRDTPRRAALDYLALGHWHSHASYPDPAPGSAAVRMAYAGTHETTKFGERDSGNVLLVEIDAPGAAPRLTPIRTGRLTWITLDRRLETKGDLHGVLDDLKQVPDAPASLVDLRLTGLLDPEDTLLLDDIRSALATRFLHGRLRTAGLHATPREADLSWLDRLPPGVARGVALRLADLAAQADEEEGECSGDSTGEGLPVPSTVAVRALRELYLMAREGGQS